MSALTKIVAKGANNFRFRASRNILWNARFSTKPDSSSAPSLPVKCNVLNDIGILLLEQIKITNLGSGYGKLVDYNLLTKGGDPLFSVEHFYGPASPYFYINLKSKMEDKHPLIHMTYIRNIQNQIRGMTFFVYPSKIIGTLELMPNGDEGRHILKSVSGTIEAQLSSNEGRGLSTKIRIMSPNGAKILGKVTKTKQQMIRSRLDAEFHYPVTLDLLVKVQLIGAAIYLMGQT